MNLGKVVLVGGTGMVGREILEVMKKHDLKPSKLIITGLRTIGTNSITPYGELPVVALDENTLIDAQFVFFAAGASVSRELIPKLRGRDFRIIDLSSAFRYKTDVPLIIPSINGDAIGQADLISCPNCTTSIALMALAPIHKNCGITRVNLVSYQAASGAGKDALDDLENQIEAWSLNGFPIVDDCHTGNVPLPLAGNLIPRIDVLDPIWCGFTKEEMKTQWESQKILFGLNNKEKVFVNSTCVRVPIRRCHSMVLTIELEHTSNSLEIENILNNAFGVTVIDDAQNWSLPIPLKMEGKEEIGVGRIRFSPDKNGKELILWICGDQLLRGAALTAVEIVEFILDKKISY
ncbi:MAG: aspartate-semialdehyde dehydrogenase [Candidatus Buchananbacteria bacterium]|nr:aspartate-semialdehyde dehydrogenase [Candidatus Buchananbacteria bacterium]